MARFQGDPVPGHPGETYKANAPGKNFWYDLTFNEDKCVWKNREQLEDYFRTMIAIGWATCWTIAGLLLAIRKTQLLNASKKRTDHRMKSASTP